MIGTPPITSKGLTNTAIRKAGRLPAHGRGALEHILSKLGFTSRTQIAASIIENHLVDVVEGED
ncbi:hypothetical protein CJ177_43470 [Rhodococcus sp. ACPA1]|nr:hypothetical protein CJ177_43470 [Rhodococcus sp. ACPA1]